MILTGIAAASIGLSVWGLRRADWLGDVILSVMSVVSLGLVVTMLTGAQ